MKAYKAGHIYTGVDVLHNHAILVENGLIHAVIPSVSIDQELTVVDFGAASIASPFIDLQIYGGRGVLFAEQPTAESLYLMYQHCKASGTAWFLPTIATNKMEIVYSAIDAVKSYWASGGKGVLGLHLEGPWINPAKAGAQAQQYILQATGQQVKELLAHGADVIKMITLAPEVVEPELLDLIRAHNIIVSAGHSDATYEQAINAFSNGIEVVTHLFNGMSGLQHRQPGLVGACFNHPTVRAGIIADGVHVHYATLRIAKKLLGDRLFAITDAVTESGGVYKHTFHKGFYQISGTLSGSALTMLQAAKNLYEHAGIARDEALRMCSVYPARVLNKGDEMCMIRKTYPADFIVLDEHMNLLEIIITDAVT